MSEERREYQKEYKKQYKEKVKRVNLTLTNAEYSAFLHASNHSKVSTYIKELALSGLTEQISIPANIQTELKELRFLIGNIASNINQIAQHSNTMRVLVDENELLGELKQMDLRVKEYTHGRLKERT